MPTDILSVLRQAGFKGQGLRTAWAIANRESKFDPRAYNPNAATGDLSYGLFQINMLGKMGADRRKQYGLSSNEDLFDPATNARVAYRMSKGGTDFGAWGVGPNAYRQTAPLDYTGFPGDKATAARPPGTRPTPPPATFGGVQQKGFTKGELNQLARQFGFKSFAAAFGNDDAGTMFKALAPVLTKIGEIGDGIPVVSDAGKAAAATGVVGRLLAQAHAYMGVRYKWGGKTPQTGFDCSGLVQWLYGQQGIKLGAYTIAQWNQGRKINPKRLKPGDVVFFNWGTHPETGEEGPLHEGLYVGGGMFLQAPRTGDVVKLSKLSDRSDLVGARRYL